MDHGYEETSVYLKCLFNFYDLKGQPGQREKSGLQTVNQKS